MDTLKLKKEFAIHQMARRFNLISGGKITDEIKNEVLNIIRNFGDGLSVLEFYSYLKRRDECYLKGTFSFDYN